MRIYVVERYHQNQKMGEPKYFLSESEMKSYIKLSNKMGQDVYRGFAINPLTKVKKSDLNNVKSFSEFEPLVKPEYKFKKKALYDKMMEDRKQQELPYLPYIYCICIALILTIIITLTLLMQL